MNGGYAEKVAVPEAALIPIPDGLDDEQAAALLLQGLTARTILAVSARLQPGESVVIHAAAGGTGSLAIQLAKRIGAGRVIALASSEEKRALTLELGADVAVDSRSEDLRAAILEANDGNEVDVVLEMSGGEAFEASLRSLAPVRPAGHLRNRLARGEQGQDRPSDAPQPRGDRLLAGAPVQQAELLREGIGELFAAAAAGELRAVIGGTYPLSEAVRAHEDIAARRTQGKLLLDPSK